MDPGIFEGVGPRSNQSGLNLCLPVGKLGKFGISLLKWCILVHFGTRYIKAQCCIFLVSFGLGLNIVFGVEHFESLNLKWCNLVHFGTSYIMAKICIHPLSLGLGNSFWSGRFLKFLKF